MWGESEREREAPGGKLDHRAPRGKEAGEGEEGEGELDMREGDKQS